MAECEVVGKILYDNSSMLRGKRELLEEDMAQLEVQERVMGFIMGVLETEQPKDILTVPVELPSSLRGMLIDSFSQFGIEGIKTEGNLYGRDRQPVEEVTYQLNDKGVSLVAVYDKGTSLMRSFSLAVRENTTN